MEANHNIVFGNPHLLKFLTNFDISVVLLQPDFAVFNVEMERAVMHSMFLVPSSAKQEVMIALCIEDKLGFYIRIVFAIAGISCE